MAKTEQQIIELVEANILTAFQKAGLISYKMCIDLLKSLDGLHSLQKKEYEELKENAAITPGTSRAGLE